MKKIVALSLILLSAVQGSELTDKDESTGLTTAQIHTEVNRVLEKFQRNMETYYQRTRAKKRKIAVRPVTTEAEDAHYHADEEHGEESQKSTQEESSSQGNQSKALVTEMPGEAVHPNAEKTHVEEDHQSAEGANSAEGNPQEKTELGQYLRNSGIKYIQCELFPLMDEQLGGRTPTLEDALIYLLLQEMKLRNSPNEKEERIELKRKRAENMEIEQRKPYMRKGLLTTNESNLDELINNDLIRFTTVFKKKTTEIFRLLMKSWSTCYSRKISIGKRLMLSGRK